MAGERFRETGKGSFFGEQVYDRVVPRDHFLRKLDEAVDWRPLPRNFYATTRGAPNTARPPMSRLLS